ncbi:hypothetical protein BD410DRAFT_847030 [Rickenella mellea]|uniref:Uncharacterized protein n=1 Tax=Rickenella mellea TaxID=50990 RepID=A0A4Y7PEX6_9AGAM|nr:hypothetical protein BD410DRAFT_847030 [Rickenella mellea]
MHVYSLTVPRSDNAIYLPAVADLEDDISEKDSSDKDSESDLTTALTNIAIDEEEETEREGVRDDENETIVRKEGKVRGRDISFGYFYVQGDKLMDLPPAPSDVQAGDVFVHRVFRKTQLWIRDVGTWKPVKIGYERTLGGENRRLSVSSSGVVAWVSLTYNRKKVAKQGRV